ncbi:hypothetical protein Naga_100910g1, partial [Nannochloropsis gaditana]
MGAPSTRRVSKSGQRDGHGVNRASFHRSPLIMALLLPLLPPPVWGWGGTRSPFPCSAFMPGGASGTSSHASTEGRRRLGWERTTGLKATTTPLTSSTTPVKAIPASPSPSTSSPPYSTVDPPSSSSSPGPSPRPSVIANKLQKPQNAPTVWVEFGALAASLPPEKIINLGQGFPNWVRREGGREGVGGTSEG